MFDDPWRIVALALLLTLTTGLAFFALGAVLSDSRGRLAKFGENLARCGYRLIVVPSVLFLVGVFAYVWTMAVLTLATTGLGTIK